MKKLFKKENFIALAVFFLPIYLWRFSILGMPTNVLEILMLLAIGCWVLVERMKGLEEKASRNKAFIAGIILILAGLFISAILSADFKTGLGIIKGWFLLPLGLAVTTLTLAKDKKVKLFQVFYLSALSVSVLALAGYFLGFKTYDQRLAVPFNSPNYLAMYLAPAVLIGIIFLKQSQKIYGATMIIILAALYLTFSYAAWVSVLLSLIILGIWTRRPYKLINPSRKIAAVIAILGLFLISQFFQPKFQAAFNTFGRSSVASRMTIWQSAGKIIKDNSIFGIGPGNFQKEYLKYQKYFPPYLEWAVPHPHNLYLEFWLSGGLLGLLGFLGIILIWLKKIAAGERNQLWAISLTVVSYFLIHGLVDTTYFKNDLSAIFWLAWLAIF